MFQLRFLSYWTGALVVLLGGLALAGWCFDIIVLKSAIPGLVSMKANTAVCLVLAGASLMLQGAPPPLPLRRVAISRTLAVLVVLAGLLTLIEYCFNVDFRFDELLFRQSSQEPGVLYPGRMSPATSIDLTLIGLSILSLDVRLRRSGWPAQWFAIIAAVVTLLAFIGYFYGIETPYRLGQYFSIALNTAMALWLLCLGVLFARPQRGLMAVFIGDNLGGILARRALPAAVLVPLLAGWLRVVGQRAGLYGVGFGSALSSTLLIVTFTGLVIWSARALNRADAARRQGAEALRQSNARFDAIISSAMDAVISVDSKHRVVVFNPAAEAMFGVASSEAIGQDLGRFIPEHFHGAHALHGESPVASAPASRRIGSIGAVTGQRASGEDFPAEASISQVEVGGEKLFTVILRDITERLRVEAGLLESERREHARRMEMEALMESAPVVVWIADDAECRRITGNRASHEMLRVAPEANVSKTAPEQQRPIHFQIFQDGLALSDGELPMQRAGREAKPVLREELELRFSDKTTRWIYGNAVPLLRGDGTVRGVVAAFVDITALKEAEQELSLSRENLRGLAARLQAVREEERTSLAREIHDVLAQELTRLKIDIAWINRQIERPIDAPRQQSLKNKLGGMAELADIAIASVQKIATELRPVVLDSLGLCAAIEWQAKDFEARTGIRCSVTVPEADLALERDRSTALFRILQESLTNVARHAKANRVDVELGCDDEWVWLHVRDNGRGIRADELSDPHSVGLLGMRERATLLGGECRILSCPSGGTSVEARVGFQSAPSVPTALT
jgi:PAS domain S-box-containing protein